MGFLDSVFKGEDFLTTRFEKLVAWGRKNSLWPMPFGTSCCAIELMATLGPRYDIARFGAEAIRFSPRQSDLLISAGTITWKMAGPLRRIYEQMPDPKWVIAMGVCTCTGGLYRNYAVVQGIDRIVPVDVYVPGCPPRPEALLEGVMKIQEKIERGEQAREGRLITVDGFKRVVAAT